MGGVIATLYNKGDDLLPKLKDITGQKFGRWTVLSRAPNRYTKSNYQLTMWNVKCDCGNTDIIRGICLHNNHSQSCGCLKSELFAEFNKQTKTKTNMYDLSGDYGVGYTSNNEEFYFDLDDYDKIKDYCWKIDGEDGYVTSNERQDNLDYKSTVYLHRVILWSNHLVDHKSGVKKDCRKQNLRIANRSQNNMNRIKGKNNTSGVIGVSWNSYHQKWGANISKNRKQYHLGYFDDFEDAVDVRKQAEEQYFGKWSLDNSRNIK